MPGRYPTAAASTSPQLNRSLGSRLSLVRTDERWWDRPKPQIGGAITGILNKLEGLQAERQRRYAGFANLYGNSQWYGGLNPTMSGTVVPWWQGRAGLPTYNIIQSITDWCVSKLAKDIPRAWFLTNDGNYHQRRKAQRLTRFNDGVSYECKSERKYTTMLRDALIFGDGFVKIFPRFGRIAQQRTLPGDLWFAEPSTINGELSDLHQVIPIDRGRARAMFPASQFPGAAAAIDKAAPIDLWTGGMSDYPSDMIALRESWHLPSGPDQRDGLRAFTVDNATLATDEWPHDFFPFVHYRWNDRVYGWLGQGAVEQLRDRQAAINKLAYILDRSFHLMSGFKIAVERGSKINKQHLARNEIANIIEYVGTMPQYMSPPPVSEQLFTYWKMLIEDSYAMFGASMLSASSVIPSNLKSGESQRVFHNIESERFWNPTKELETCVIDGARLNIATLQSITQGKKQSYAVDTVWRGRSFKRYNWKDVAFDQDDHGRDPFEIKAFATSGMPDTPAGRLATIQERTQAGWYTPTEAKRLSDDPDYQQVDQWQNAAEERIYKTCDMIADDGELPPINLPNERDNLPLFLEIAIGYWVQGEMEELEPERLALLDQVITAVQQAMDEINARNAPPPTIPPGPGMGPPGALPMPPPQTPLLANTPVPAS